MTDRSSPPSGSGVRSTPGRDPARTVVDERGVEWEIYDESAWSIALALEWDYLPQIQNPGLIFVSRVDHRRLWPCPAGWFELEAPELARLIDQARSIF
jgi:hypothetical protein